MNIAYFGSPSISALLLKELLNEKSKDYSISLVVSQPDKPAGKRLEIQSTRVSELAQAYNIPIFNKTLKFNEVELISLLKEKRIDLCIIFAFGEIISKELLTTPAYGFWNIHPSLLPLYRGPSPIVYTLLLGEKNTGVTLMQLEEKMDSGPIIEQAQTNIELYEDRNKLEERLTLIGSTLLKENLKKSIINHKIVTKPQNDTSITYTSLIRKEDGYFELPFLQAAISNTPPSINDLPTILKIYLEKYSLNKIFLESKNSNEIFYNFYKALTPWPGIWTIINTPKGKKRLKITKISFSNNLQIEYVQLEGKNEVDFKTFNASYKLLDLK